MEHNKSLGQAAGVSQEKLDALDGDYELSGLFDQRELAVIQWTEAVATNTARRNTAAFNAMAEYFDDDEIIELTTVVAVRVMVNLLQEAFWTDLEPADFPDNTKYRADMEPADWMEWYAESLREQARHVRTKGSSNHE